MSEKFPGPVYADGIRKSTQTRFGGLNHNPGAGDGELYAMKNLGSDYYPLMSTREKRRKLSDIDECNGVFGGEKLCWVDGPDFYYDGVKRGEVEDAAKGFAKLNDYILVFPDKVYFNEEFEQFGDMEAKFEAYEEDTEYQNITAEATGTLPNRRVTITREEGYGPFNNINVGDDIHFYIKRWTSETDWRWSPIGEGAVLEKSQDGTVLTTTAPGATPVDGVEKIAKRGAKKSVTFMDGTLYEEAATANTIYCEDVAWEEYFQPGDAITIRGSVINANNGTFIVREIDGDEMHFYENTFTNGTDPGAYIVLERTVPNLKFAFECDNRLWGCEGNTIYVSKPGDPFNFNVFDGLDTDSWAAEIGGTGEITGGIAFLGYPTFFKDGKVYRVYGSMPSNFEVIESATLGVAPGSEKSLAIAGEMLFYHNRHGICMFSGGLPTVINRSFGTERYRNAVGGSDGLKYYVSMQDNAGDWHMFVYDTQQGTWHEEDDTQAISFAYWDGNLYYADSAGNLMLTGNLHYHPEGTTEEEDFEWYVEFTDFTDDSPNKKGISKIQIRADLDVGATCTVKLMMDSSGDWITPKDGTIEENGKRSYYLAIIPQRADHYRMRIEGRGGCKIYSITREYYVGSELKSQTGRQ